MAPHACARRIRALSPDVQATLQGMGVVFDFQLASLDLEHLDIPMEDLAALRDVVGQSPRLSRDPGDAGAVAGDGRTIIRDVEVLASDNGAVGEETLVAPPSAAKQDDNFLRNTDSVDEGKTGKQKSDDDPCPRRCTRESSPGAKLLRQPLGTRAKLKRVDGDSACAPYFHIFESEVRRIAANSAEQRRLETCGDFYGLWTQDGRAVVALVSSPGPNAVHERAYCAQDIDFFRANTEFLHNRFGLQFLGHWHSHHELGLDRPSAGDVEQIRSLSTRNNLSHLVEIITTHEEADRNRVSPKRCSRRHQYARGASWLPWSTGRSNSSPSDSIAVRINAFEHANPQAGQPRRCAIRVLPGTSPYRLALAAEASLHHAEFATQAFDFPMDRILFDSFERPSHGGGGDQGESAIPEALVEQCERLPSAVVDKMTVTVDEGLIVFELAASSGATVLIAYEYDAPHTAKAIAFKPTDGNKLVDATAYVLEDRLCLSIGQIYMRMASFDLRRNAPVAGAEGSAATQSTARARTTPECAGAATPAQNSVGTEKDRR